MENCMIVDVRRLLLACQAVLEVFNARSAINITVTFTPFIPPKTTTPLAALLSKQSRSDPSMSGPMSQPIIY